MSMYNILWSHSTKDCTHQRAGSAHTLPCTNASRMSIHSCILMLHMFAHTSTRITSCGPSRSDCVTIQSAMPAAVPLPITPAPLGGELRQSPVCAPVHVRMCARVVACQSPRCHHTRLLFRLCGLVSRSCCWAKYWSRLCTSLSHPAPQCETASSHVYTHARTDVYSHA